jgi:hypothetical protein
MSYFIADACIALRPEAGVSIEGNVITWSNVDDIPSDAEVQAKAAELEAAYNATQYQRDRQPEYPDLAVLADALYWSNQGDNTKLDEYYAACAAVKAKYPKPEVN